MVRSYVINFREVSRNVKLFLVGNALQGMGLSIYSLLFNLYLKELGHTEGIIGNLISTTSLGIALMAIPVAFIIEKFHVKHLVITGLILSSFFYGVQVLNIDEKSIFTFGLIASMFQALYNISVPPFYLRNSKPNARVQLFTLNSSLNMGTHLLGYLVGGYLPKIVHHFAPSFDTIATYRYSIIFAVSLIFLANILFAQIKKVPIPKSDHRFVEQLRGREWKVLSKLVLPKLCFAFGGGLVVPFMNLYLKERFQFSTEMIGISYALMQLFIFLGIFVTPLFMKKTTQLKFIMVTSSLSIPFMLALGITGSVGFALCCFFLRAMLMNMSGPISSVFEMERVREKECAFASAIILFSYHLVYASSTKLGGFLIERYSFGPTFYIAAVSYIAAIVLYYRFFRIEDRAKVIELKTTQSVSKAS